MLPHSRLNQTLWLSSRRFILEFSAVVSATPLFSVLVLAFKADASVTYLGATDDGHTFWGSLQPNDDPNGDDPHALYLFLYPESLDLGSVKPTLATAGISLVLALSFGVWGGFVHRRGKALLLSGLQRITIFLALGVNCVLSLVVYVIYFIRHFQSAKFEPGYLSTSSQYMAYEMDGIYDNGTFDLMSWSCEVRAYGAYNNNDQILSRQCTDETAALCIGPLLVLANLGMAWLVWMDWEGQRVLIRDLKDVMNEYDIQYLGGRNPFT